MEYIKNNKGLNTAIIVTKEEDFDVLEELSLKTNTKVYLIPEATEVSLDENGWIVSAKGDTKNIWQFIKGWAMPYECFVRGFPFPVKMEEMWLSQKDVEDIPIEELRWNLKLPWWSTDEQIPYNLKPEEVLVDINAYKEHKDRIENSDIKYPLLLVQTKQDRWLIYDGVHRFVRLILEGKQNVSCQKFSIEEMEQYVPDSHKELFSEWLDWGYK